MAATTGLIQLTGDGWTKIADSGLGSFSFQNKGLKDIHIAATAADAAPSDEGTNWPSWAAGEGEIGYDMTALFAGVTSAAYLWAYVHGNGDGVMWRSHA